MYSSIVALAELDADLGPDRVDGVRERVVSVMSPNCSPPKLFSGAPEMTLPFLAETVESG